MDVRPLAVFTALITACGDTGTVHARDAVPTALEPTVLVAEAAMDALQQRLAARLQGAVAEGGTQAAVSVCHDEAPVIAKAVADEHAVALGRTSHKLRSPDNAPRPWLEPFVDRAMTEPLAGPMVVDLGDRVGVVRPLFVLGPCLQCHGDSSHVASDVAAAIARTYPEDRAIGFAEGELRGFLWAEAPRPSAGG